METAPENRTSAERTEDTDVQPGASVHRIWFVILFLWEKGK